MKTKARLVRVEQNFDLQPNFYQKTFIGEAAKKVVWLVKAPYTFLKWENQQRQQIDNSVGIKKLNCNYIEHRIWAEKEGLVVGWANQKS